jgi:hypothetical protein
MSRFLAGAAVCATTYPAAAAVRVAEAAALRIGLEVFQPERVRRPEAQRRGGGHTQGLLLLGASY